MNGPDFERIIRKSFSRKGFTGITIEVEPSTMKATVSGEHPRLGHKVYDCTIETDTGKEMLMVRFHGMEYGSWVDDTRFI